MFLAHGNLYRQSNKINTLCKLKFLFYFVFFLIYLIIKGLHQHYVKLNENKKGDKLIDLLEKLEFNQVVIFVKSVLHCKVLCELLTERNFPAIEIHFEMPQDEWFVEFGKKETY